jgi:hypothetical protein
MRAKIPGCDRQSLIVKNDNHNPLPLESEFEALNCVSSQDSLDREYIV